MNLPKEKWCILNHNQNKQNNENNNKNKNKNKNNNNNNNHAIYFVLRNPILNYREGFGIPHIGLCTMVEYDFTRSVKSLPRGPLFWNQASKVAAAIIDIVSFRIVS